MGCASAFGLGCSASTLNVALGKDGQGYESAACRLHVLGQVYGTRWSWAVLGFG